MKKIAGQHFKLGERYALFYEQKDKWWEIVAAFYLAGLEKREKGIYLAGPKEIALLETYFSQVKLDSKLLEKKGKFLFISLEELVNHFKPQKLLSYVQKIIETSLKENYQGLRISADLNFLFQKPAYLDKILEAESILRNKFWGKYPLILICLYPLAGFPSFLVPRVFAYYPWIIWQGNFYRNPYFLDWQVDAAHLKEILNKLPQKGFSLSQGQRDKLLARYTKKLDMLQANIQQEIIIALTEMLEIHDAYTKGHSNNVANLAEKIARKMGFAPQTIEEAYWSGMTHDIGKTLIPIPILNKKAALTREELTIVQQHPVWGYKTLKKSKILQNIARNILYHHERWDGKGYPYGLAAGRIPIISQILTLADAWDAMRSDRSYRQALSKAEALEEVRKNTGSQFSPRVVEAFLKLVEAC